MLQGGYGVLSFDYRRHVYEDPGPDVLTSHLQDIEAAYDVADRLAEGAPVLVFAAGAIGAGQAAAVAPDSTAAMVLVFPVTDGRRWLLDGHDAADPNDLEAELAEREAKHDPWIPLEIVRPQLRNSGTTRVGIATVREVLGFSLRPDEAPSTVPTMLVSARNDQIVPEWHAEAMVDLFRRSVRVSMAGADHYETYDLYSDFLPSLATSWFDSMLPSTSAPQAVLPGDHRRPEHRSETETDVSSSGV